MNVGMFRAFLLLVIFPGTIASAAPIERIWLSHEEETPATLTVSWETTEPSPSVVSYGSGPDLGSRAKKDGLSTRHHVRIPFERGEGELHYRVGEGEEISAVHRVKRHPADELRIAVVADWGYAPGKDLSALLRDEPHLLLTGGDNVPSLHGAGHEGTKAFAALIDACPDLFQTVPFLPILGNHDREVRPRGPEPPAEPVYDVEASDYREFFALPGDEWKWRFGIPAFDFSVVALDLNHISDFGTTWQTCHPWQEDSVQFQWYAKTMGELKSGFVVTLMNEKQTALNGATKGAWQREFQRGSALITGFGYFQERAEIESGLPVFNTCLKGDGSLYLDPRTRFHAQEDGYLLLTLKAGAPTMRVEIKNLKGAVLDSIEIAKRP